MVGIRLFANFDLMNVEPHCGSFDCQGEIIGTFSTMGNSFYEASFLLSKYHWRRILFRGLDWLSRQPEWFHWVFGSGMVALISWMDFLTKFDGYLTFYYLIPVAYGAWLLGKKGGLVFSILDLLAWGIANAVSDYLYIRPFTHYFVMVDRGMVFVAFTFLFNGLHQALEHEKSVARIDPLTGAYNRRALYDAISQEFLRFRRYHRPMSLLYLDVDNFKTINDTLGHMAGDDLLNRSVRVILKNIRSTDVLGRLGGDEFALLLPETDASSAQCIAARLRSCLLAEMETQTFPVTCSIGVITCLDLPHDADELIRFADLLMYDVKLSTKNGIAFAVYDGDIVRPFSIN